MVDTFNFIAFFNLQAHQQVVHDVLDSVQALIDNRQVAIYQCFIVWMLAERIDTIQQASQRVVDFVRNAGSDTTQCDQLLTHGDFFLEHLFFGQFRHNLVKGGAKASDFIAFFY